MSKRAVLSMCPRKTSLSMDPSLLSRSAMVPLPRRSIVPLGKTSRYLPTPTTPRLVVKIGENVKSLSSEMAQK